MVLGNMEKDERKTDRSAAGGGSLIRAVREDLMEKVTFERSSEWVERKPRPALGMNRQSNQGGSLRQACARPGAVGVGVGVGGEAEAMGEVQPRWQCDATVMAFHQSAKGAIRLKCEQHPSDCCVENGLNRGKGNRRVRVSTVIIQIRKLWGLRLGW